MLGHAFFRRLQFLLSRDKQRQELEEEMRLHIELRTQKLLQQDLRAPEYMAQRLFGNQTLLKEQANDMWGWNWLEDLARDLKQTKRMLAANPGFAVIAILTLALGIGANTAIFTVTNALLLKSFPLPDPQQLYRVFTTRQPWTVGNTGDSTTSFSNNLYQHLRTNQRVLSALVAYVPLGFDKISVRAGSLPEEVAAEMVSGNFFTGLGARAACGRTLLPEDETAHTSFAELSYGYANRRFGNACSAIGNSIDIKGVPFTVVGVTAPNFLGVESRPSDIWIPLQNRPELNAWGSADASYWSDPKWWCILMMARLKPGVSQAAAEAALNPPFVHAAYDPLGGKPARGEQPVRLSLVPAKGIPGLDTFKQPLIILQVMVGLLLLIACANVAMLLAVRNTARGREFCVRLAIGGSRSRLIRQLLAESMVLVFGGTILGLAFALLATRALASWAQLEIPPAPDGTVLLFTCLVSVLAALAFGIGPAFGVMRVALANAIKNSAATAFRDRSRVTSGNILTTVQIALCLVLLVGMTLLVRTLQNLKDVNLGFRTSGLLVFGLSPEMSDQKQATAFYQDLIARLRSLPQVQSVTLMGNRPGTNWSNNTTAMVDGKPPENVSNDMMRWNNVGPDFFTTLGVPFLSGRDFKDSDTAQSAPVAIVNQLFADRFLKGRNALGHTASYTNSKPFTIIGVVENHKYIGVGEDPIPMAWFPYLQVGDIGAMHVELRTVLPPLNILPAVRAKVAEIAPELALLQPRTQQAEFDRSISSEALLARLSLSFAVIAVVLVTIGLYGTISYSVRRRTTEVGIRVALGAERNAVIWMILRSALLLCGFGLALGIPLALASSRYMASLLYGVKPTDPASLVSAVIGILAVGAIATYLPARRAASIDAMQALRYE